MEPIDKVIQSLHDHACNPRQTGPKQWEARCPAHDDKNPSLGVSIGSEDRVMLHCHAGCEFAAIMWALNLQMEDAFPKDVNRDRDHESSTTIDKTYPYHDADGTLVYEVVRLWPKSFRQRRPNGSGGWIWNLKGVTPTLYRLPKVIDAVNRGERVIITEGEKDVETLEKQGLVATTNSGGAGKWLDIFNQHFVGAEVVIVSDRDNAGRKHALYLIEQLTPVAKDIVWLEPMAPYKDVTQHIGAGHSLEELVDVNKDEEERALASREEVGKDIMEAMSEIALYVKDTEIEPGELVSRARLRLAEVTAPPVGIDQLWGMDELTDSDEEPFDWVIPGLLEHKDRMMLIAGEAVGKSMFQMQFCALAAQGIHPYNQHDIAPVRTLVVDLENSSRNYRRKLAGVTRTLREHRGDAYIEGASHVWFQPGGIDLLNSNDVARLEQVIDRTEPEILAFGPMYKAYNEVSDQRELQTGKVQRVLDYLRDKYNMALVLEHHAPKGAAGTKRKMEPFGSSYWLRWLDYGLAFYPIEDSPLNNGDKVKHVKLTMWKSRGDEHAHCFPSEMQWGNKWPWEFRYPNDNWRKWVRDNPY